MKIFVYRLQTHLQFDNVSHWDWRIDISAFD